MMAILGWVVLCFFAVVSTGSSLFLIAADTYLEGKVNTRALIPVITTALLWWAVIANAPFEVVIK